MEIENVKCWVVRDGISHAVALVKDPGCYTLCDSLMWGDFPKRGSKHNGRICSKCRKLLKLRDESGKEIAA